MYSSQQKVGLQNADALAKAIRGSDVQVVLCGHFHLQLTGFLAGIPVIVEPGIIGRVDLTAPSRLDRAVRGAHASVVDLGGPMSPRIHLLQAGDAQAGETVYLCLCLCLVDAMTGVDVPIED
jgi:Icc protein